MLYRSETQRKKGHTAVSKSRITVLAFQKKLYPKHHNAVKGDRVRMRNSRLVGVTLVAALALSVSISAASSSAATVGWMVNGTLLSGSKALATTAQVEKNFTAGFAGVKVECTGLNATAPQITAPNKGSATSIEFTGCAGAAPCSIEGSTIKLLPVLLEASASGALAVTATFTTDASKHLFTTLKFLGATCSVGGETVPLSGQFKALASRGQDEQVGQLFAAKVTEASEEFKVGSSNASLECYIIIVLATSVPWSFL
jgi:hypothetical protein